MPGMEGVDGEQGMPDTPACCSRTPLGHPCHFPDGPHRKPLPNSPHSLFLTHFGEGFPILLSEKPFHVPGHTPVISSLNLIPCFLPKCHLNCHLPFPKQYRGGKPVLLGGSDVSHTSQVTEQQHGETEDLKVSPGFEFWL